MSIVAVDANQVIKPVVDFRRHDGIFGLPVALLMMSTGGTNSPLVHRW